MGAAIEKGKRPKSITAVCILGSISYLLVFTGIPLVLTSNSHDWFLLYLIFSATIGLIAIANLWQMKKWAAYTFIGVLALNQVVTYVMGFWSLIGLILPAVATYFILKNGSKMT